MHRAKQILSID